MSEGRKPERMTIRVAIVDDHPLIVEGIRAALGQHPGIDVIGTASSTSSIRSARSCQPATTRGRDSPVRLWLDEPNAAAVLGTPPFPDGVIAIESHRRSGVICLEIDEATQRRAVIEAKLNGYRRLLDANPTWWLLFMVPSRTRAWMAPVGRRPG
jgi:hypothetical protein